ncbi:hypothetical protein [Dyella monticola]|uniref:hypothetical protein n=1 Tax=Dyella monticola TaxID=1927958 RepID=UPI001315024B|nr:hypothetical protein [Dyella monticola]
MLVSRCLVCGQELHSLIAAEMRGGSRASRTALRDFLECVPSLNDGIVVASGTDISRFGCGVAEVNELQVFFAFHNELLLPWI